MRLKFCITDMVKERVKSGNGELCKRVRLPIVHRIRDRRCRASVSDAKAAMLYEYYRVYGYDDYMP